MPNREVKEALMRKNKLNTYLREMTAERDRLLGDVLVDPIEATNRLAQVDAELAAGKEVFRKVSNLYDEIRRRKTKAEGRGNYIIGIAKRG